MHIKKNVIDNIFNTVMDMEGETKDNIKARMDLVLYYDHCNMDFLVIGYRSQRLKPSSF